MRERGFTLVELIVVMALISILLTIGAIQFNSYTTKGKIESQIKMMQSDLAEARVQALFQKRPRAVVITGSQFSLYSSLATSGSPVLQKTLDYPVQSNGTGAINFDASGLLSNVGTGRSICLSVGNNPATIDSIVFSTTRIYSGKWNLPEGSNDQCKAENIKQQ